MDYIEFSDDIFLYLMAAVILVTILVSIWYKPIRGVFLILIFLPLENNILLISDYSIIMIIGLITFIVTLLRIPLDRIKLLGQLKYIMLPTFFLIQIGLSSLFAEGNPYGDRFYFLTYLQLLLFMALIFWLISDLKKAEEASIAFLIGVFIASLSGVWEYLSGSVAIAAGLVGNANALALIAAMSLPIVSYFCMGRGLQRTLVFWGWAALTTIVTMYSFSRSGLIVFILATLLIVFRQYMTKRNMIILSVSIFLIAGILYGASPEYYERIASLEGSHENRGDTIFKRIEWSKVSLQMGMEDPWFGVGPGNWGHELHTKYSGDVDPVAIRKTTVAHNTFLEVFAELGAIGLFLFVLLIIQVLYFFFKFTYSPKNNQQGNIKKLAAAWGIAFICFIIFAVKGSMQYFKLFWMLCGIAIALNQLYYKSLSPGWVLRR